MFEAIFGVDLPLPVKFLLALILFGVIIVVVLVLIAKVVVRQDRPIPPLNRGFLIRRAVLRVAEFIAVVQVIMLTILGYIGGAGYAQFLTAMTGNRNTSVAVLAGGIIGGISGFVFSVGWTALLFTLSGIERNTRHTALMLELIARPRKDTREEPRA
jgi:hypothetical protein